MHREKMLNAKNHEAQKHDTPSWILFDIDAVKIKIFWPSSIKAVKIEIFWPSARLIKQKNRR